MKQSAATPDEPSPSLEEMIAEAGRLAMEEVAQELRDGKMPDDSKAPNASALEIALNPGCRRIYGTNDKTSMKIDDLLKLKQECEHRRPR